ncbi:MAG: DUF4169 family protein [Pseudomonadota bacterium]
MAKPINLNKMRKTKARDSAQARADENAMKFGRTKSEKARDKAQRDKANRLVEGHKREP